MLGFAFQGSLQSRTLLFPGDGVAAVHAPESAPAVGCTINQAANITVSIPAGQCGTIVNYPQPTTSGSCGAVTCVPPSGSFFSTGTTTVTCTESSGALMTFTVTVTGGGPAAGVLRDDFNRANGPVLGSNRWAGITNIPNSGALQVVNNQMEASSSAGNNNFGGFAWDTLMSAGTEASVTVTQKSGVTAYSSLFIYARMNNKDYSTGTGYRLRFNELTGADLIEIDKVTGGYANAVSLGSTTKEINAGDVITFRVLCDNQTMVALVNGSQVLSVKDVSYNPSQWYFAIRAGVFATPVMFDNFTVSTQSPVSAPSAPVLSAPVNGATGQPLTLTLAWNSSSGANSYRCQVATDSLFTAIIVDDSSLTAPSRSTGPLLSGVKYYWRVNAKNSFGTSLYSQVWNFATSSGSGGTVHHYEYVFPDGKIFVYDIDNGHALVKSMDVPTISGTRGVTVSPADSVMYISYGGDGGAFGNGSMLQYDLLRDSIRWIVNYNHGIDSHAMTPDGKTIFMPSGEASSDGNWYVVNASDGSEKGVIATTGYSPHNTIVGPDGKFVYLGCRNLYASGSDSFYVASTATYKVVKSIGTMLSGVRPFTINGEQTIAYVVVTGLLGFQVCDLTNNKILYTVDMTTMGFPKTSCGTQCETAPSHGISLSPDEKELYVVDNPNGYVHVFDVSGISQSQAPVKVADIKLQHDLTGYDSSCAYDCARGGWLHHSVDGRYVYVGESGDVISTATRTIVAWLPALRNKKVMLEIDFQNGVPVATSTRSSIGHGATATPPSVPVLVSPANGAANQSASPLLAWNGSANTATYRVQLATDSLFTGIILNDSTVTSASRQVNSLAGGTKYYWRVNAKNTSGTSAYSPTWNFTTSSGAPPTPVLISPPNLAGCQFTTLTFSWAASSGATSYRFQLAADQAFTAIVVDTTITGTTKQVSNLAGNTAYSWRVSAGNGFGSSPFSARWAFGTFPVSTVRDNFNRTDGALAGSNKWVLIQNQPSSGAMNIVGNAIQPASSAGNLNFGGVAWDSLCGAGSEASFTLLQKGGNYSYSSLFIYAKMNNKDYTTGTGYRLRYQELGGTDLLEIHRVGPGYANSATIASKNLELNAGDAISFRVLCDNKTLVALVNGVPQVTAVDSTYMPSQWYFAVRSCVFPTPVRLDNFATNVAGVVPSRIVPMGRLADEQIVPAGYNLENNYPNPFNPTTRLKYSLPFESQVRLVVYNMLGQEVKVLINGMQRSGYYEAEWNASGIASGIYFYRLDAASVSDPSKHFSQMRKMILIK
jgi:hypothetical protein